MIRRVTAAVAVLLCAVLLASCGDASVFSDSENLTKKVKRSTDTALTYHYADGAQDPPTTYTTFANGVTTFALSAFRARSQAEKGSFVFSTASSFLQLNLLANAASADTRLEILQALAGNLTLDDCNACSSYFKSRIESVSKIGQKEAPDAQVTLGGALLVDKDTDVKTSFLQTDQNFFGYDVFRFDFKDEHAASKLDAYFKDYTDSSGISLTGGTMHTASALSVSDAWLEASVPTGKGTFNGADGAREADYFTSDAKALKSDKATGVMKYTAKTPLKLLLIQPKEGTSLGDYIDSFDIHELEALLGSVDITAKDVAAIPAFSVTTDKKAVPLSDSLSKSGLYSLFTDKAGFSALNYTNNGKLGEMYEIPTDFTVSQNGVNAEASAAAKADAQKPTVTIDRPFIFMLLDNESNLPLLMGQYQ